MTFTHIWVRKKCPKKKENDINIHIGNHTAEKKPSNAHGGIQVIVNSELRRKDLRKHKPLYFCNKPEWHAMAGHGEFQVRFSHQASH